MSKRPIFIALICIALAIGLWHLRGAASMPPRDEVVATLACKIDSGDTRSDLANALGSPSRERIGIDTAAAPAQAAAPTSSVVVRVVAKETGRRLRSVHVTLCPQNRGDGFDITEVEKSLGTMHETLRSNDDGSVEFIDVASDIELYLSASGDEDVAGSADQIVHALRAGERREVSIALATRDDLEFWGRVVKRFDRAPIAHARIRVVRARRAWDALGNGPKQWVLKDKDLFDVTCDDDGVFALSLARWKEPYLRVEVPAFGTAIVVPKTGHETRERAQSIELAAAGRLDARVVDARGNPVGGAHVVLDCNGYFLQEDAVRTNDWGFDSLPTDRWEAETRTDGRCSVENLPPDVPIHASIVVDGKPARRIEESLFVGSGQTLETEWRIGGGCTLNGLLLDQNDQPVIAQEIWLLKCEPSSRADFAPFVNGRDVVRSTTRADGRFEFKDVMAGSWCIGPSATAEVAALTDHVEVKDTPSQDIVLHAHRGLDIRGVVVDPKGEPVPGCFVSGGLESRPDALEARTSGDGSFTLGPLVPGTFVLQVTHAGRLAPSDVVKAEAGARDVVIRLRPGGALRGRVVDEVTGARTMGNVLITPEHPSAGPFGNGSSADTTDDGSFEFLGLEPGLYGIAVRTEDGRFGVLSSIRVAAERPSDGLVLTASRGGRLRVRYDGASSSASFTITSGGVRIDWEDLVFAGGGKSVVKPAPSGSLSMQLAIGESRRPRTMTVQLGAGEEKEIVIHDGE